MFADLKKAIDSHSQEMIQSTNPNEGVCKKATLQLNCDVAFL